MHIGLADFAESTLLILGDATSMRLLADCIEARECIAMSALPFVELVNVNVLMTPTEDMGTLDQKGMRFEWKISSWEARQFAEQLRGLAASEIPAHAYLDCKTSGEGKQVIASKGEYCAGDVFGLSAKGGDNAKSDGSAIAIFDALAGLPADSTTDARSVDPPQQREAL